MIVRPQTASAMLLAAGLSACTVKSFRLMPVSGRVVVLSPAVKNPEAVFGVADVPRGSAHSDACSGSAGGFELQRDFVVLSAANPAELEQRTEQFRAGAAAYLTTAVPQTYSLLPKGVGINPYIQVMVNSRTVDVPLVDNTVRQVFLQELNTTAVKTLPEKLVIRVRHGKKFYPLNWGSTDILNYRLEGGENIQYGVPGRSDRKGP